MCIFWNSGTLTVDKMNLSDKIKANIPIIEVAGNYIKVNSSGRAKCPFHKGEHLSLSFDKDKNNFKCFNCEASGSVIDFVMQMEKLSFKEALNKLASKYTITNETQNKAITQPRIKINTNIQPTAKTLEIYRYFDNIIDLTDRGKAYLNNRGLSDKTLQKFNVKSIDKPNKVFTKLKDKYSLNELKPAGFINRLNRFIFFNPCIVFTSYRKDKPVYFNNRNLTGEIKSFKMTGVKEKWFVGNMLKDEIYLFEGIFDALSLYEMNGIDNFIALNGLITKAKTKQIENYYKEKQIIYIFDNDVAGAKSRMKIEKNYRINVLTWKTITKNVNDVYDEMKKEFKTYDKAKYFRNEKNLKRFTPYLKANPDILIKDINDYLRYGEDEEQPIKYFGYSLNEIKEIRKNIDFNFETEIKQFPNLMNEPEKAFDLVTNLINVKIKQKILMFCITNSHKFKRFSPIAEAIRC